MVDRHRHQTLVLPEYNAAADFEWIQRQSKLPWLRLQIDIPHQQMLDEIQRLPIPLTHHRDDYAEHQGWLSGCIHGRAFDQTREPHHYHDARPLSWTSEALEHLPVTVEFFKHVWPAQKYGRVRIMLLQAQGFIAPHRDDTQPCLWPINIALSQPKHCDFVMQDHGIIPFEPGAAFMLDITNLHTVVNDSAQDRYHIIVHQDTSCPEFQHLVVKSYHNMYNNHYETSKTDHTR